MNIYTHVVSTLNPTGVPLGFRTYNGTANTYMTYFVEDFPELNADDTEQVTGYFVQVEVFSKSNYYNLVEQIKELMKQAGFERLNSVDDPYSSETEMFHKVMTFHYSA